MAYNLPLHLPPHLPQQGKSATIAPSLFPFSGEEHPMPSRFELANAIRALSMDAVQKAKSG
ncbi:MAG: hypothetical protein ACTH5L_09655, partial [Halomonas sp.]